jgi:hypothetical protein
VHLVSLSKQKLVLVSFILTHLRLSPSGRVCRIYRLMGGAHVDEVVLLLVLVLLTAAAATCLCYRCWGWHMRHLFAVFLALLRACLAVVPLFSRV